MPGRPLVGLGQLNYVTAVGFHDFRDRTTMNFQQSAKDQADQLAVDRLAVEKFAVGQSVPRKEDPKLLRGEGRYTDDVSLPGQGYAVMVRSQNGHGVIRSI